MILNLTPISIRRLIGTRPFLVKILDNIGWLFVENIVRMGIGLFVGIWVARYLGPKQFGLISYASAFVSLFSILATLGLNSIVVRDLVKDPDNVNTTLGTAALLQFAGGIVAFVIMVGVISWVRPQDTVTHLIVVIIGLAMPFKAADIATYWFESQVQSKYVVWAHNVVILVSSIVKISLILVNASLIAFVWTMLAEMVLSLLTVLMVFAHKGPHLTGFRVQFGRAFTLLKDSLPLMLSGFAVMIYMKIDQVMLGQMLGDKAVGIYSAAVTISEACYFIPIAIVASIFPALIDAKNISDSLYYERLQQLYDLMVILSIAIAGPMTFFSDWFINLLYGRAYQEAGGVLTIHIWASIFVFLGVASSKWFIIENRQILSLLGTALGAVINIVLNFIFIPKYSVVGAAWATVISQGIASMLFDIIQSETRHMFTMKMSSFNITRLLGIWSLIRNSNSNT